MIRRLTILLNIALLFVGCDSSPTSSGSSHSEGDTAEGGDCVWVDPYHRSDRTCVRGHWKIRLKPFQEHIIKIYRSCILLI